MRINHVALEKNMNWYDKNPYFYCVFWVIRRDGENTHTQRYEVSTPLRYQRVKSMLDALWVEGIDW